MNSASRFQETCGVKRGTRRRIVVSRKESIDIAFDSLKKNDARRFDIGSKFNKTGKNEEIDPVLGCSEDTRL